MSSIEALPRALFGGPLLGDRALRFIFVDEAGVSAPESYTVVVGILVDADSELVAAEALVRETMGAVPEALREGFRFSAKAVWGNPKYQAKWLLANRLRFLCNLMNVPAKMKLPIAVSVIPRSIDYGFPDDVVERARFQHAAAFAQCMSRADKYIRERGRPSEVGTVVAEIVDPDVKRERKLFTDAFREKTLNFTPEMIHQTAEERSLGYIKQETETRISRIRSTVHYVEKGEEPLVDVADACAYGIRAYLNQKQFGDLFIASLGVPMPREDWCTVGGFAVMRPLP